VDDVRWVIYIGAGLCGFGVLYLLSTAVLARRELAAVRREFSELDWAPLSYASSADGTAPLHMLAVWPRQTRRMRLTVMMHGYTESAADYFSAACHQARQGRMVLLPDMRGRHSALRYPMELLARRRPLGLRLPLWRSVLSTSVSPLASGVFTSAGRPDSGGVELLDIRDAVMLARSRFRGRLEPGADIVGYSGGATSALLAAMRFPALFQRVMAFFPILDFAAQEQHLQQLGRGPLQQLRTWIGGGPTQAGRLAARAGRLAARRLLDGLQNLRRASVVVLADSADELSPPGPLQQLTRRAKPYPNLQVRISHPGDERRFQHETPDEDSPLRSRWPEPPAGANPLIDGSWSVLGYLVAPDVEIWLDDGQQGHARCIITRGADRVTVQLEPVELQPGARVRLRVRFDDRWQERVVPPRRGTHHFERSTNNRRGPE